MTTILKERLSKMAYQQPSRWQEKAKYRRDNREWLKKSAAIALTVLEALKMQNLSRKDLADLLNVSPQQLKQIVKGQGNLTLECISKLEKALGIKILN